MYFDWTIKCFEFEFEFLLLLLVNRQNLNLNLRSTPGVRGHLGFQTYACEGRCQLHHSYYPTIAALDSSRTMGLCGYGAVAMGP
jgi:hypothetical protein